MGVTAEAIKPWPPTQYTEPLTPDFRSLYDDYAKAFAIIWVTAFGYALEAWQVELLRAITELRPDGRLRYRQVLVSLGRQNGKTEIAAALGILFMLAKKSPRVIGIASTAEQARLVYDRAMTAVSRNGSLKKRFAKLTDTRGLSTLSGGKWELKASKSAALQGIPIDLGIVDEVHLIKAALWTDLVNGLGGRPNCMVVGITTAGDDGSELLLRLYGLEADTFGRFIWEAPEPMLPQDDETLGAYLAAANPAIASGRRDLAIEIEDARSQPAGEAIRYKLNRFVSGSDHSYITLPEWQKCRGDVDIANPIMVIERSNDWAYATIVAAGKAGDGVVETEVVASLTAPTIESLADECTRLYQLSGATFACDSWTLKPLYFELKRRGIPCRLISVGDITSAAAMLYSRVQRRAIRHPGDELLTRQLPAAMRKTYGEGFRITSVDRSRPIDSVIATAEAVYLAETVTPPEVQIF